MAFVLPFSICTVATVSLFCKATEKDAPVLRWDCRRHTPSPESTASPRFLHKQMATVKKTKEQKPNDIVRKRLVSEQR